jgi:hypothetical protein
MQFMNSQVGVVVLVRPLSLWSSHVWVQVEKTMGGVWGVSPTLNAFDPDELSIVAACGGYICKSVASVAFPPIFDPNPLKNPNQYHNHMPVLYPLSGKAPLGLYIYKNHWS